MVQPDHRQLGTAAHQGKALAVEVPTATRSRHYPQKSYTIYVTPPGQGPKITLTQERPRTGGVDSIRRGKAPPLAGFGDFCPNKSHPSGARPCQTGKSVPEILEKVNPSKVNPSVSLTADSPLCTRGPLGLEKS